MTLSDLSLKRPVLATVMSILIVILGIAGLTRMPVRELPNTSTAEVTVSVQYTGAGPSVVDSRSPRLSRARFPPWPGSTGSRPRPSLAARAP